MAHSPQHHDKLWLLHSAHPSPSTTSATNLPVPLYPRLSHHPEGYNRTGGKVWRKAEIQWGKGSRWATAREGSSGLCSRSEEQRGDPSSSGSGRATRRALLRLGTEPRQHT